MTGQNKGDYTWASYLLMIVEEDRIKRDQSPVSPSNELLDSSENLAISKYLKFLSEFYGKNGGVRVVDNSKEVIGKKLEYENRLSSYSKAHPSRALNDARQLAFHRTSELGRTSEWFNSFEIVFSEGTKAAMNAGYTKNRAEAALVIMDVSLAAAWEVSLGDQEGFKDNPFEVRAELHEMGGIVDKMPDQGVLFDMSNNLQGFNHWFDVYGIGPEH